MRASQRRTMAEALNVCIETILNLETISQGKSIHFFTASVIHAEKSYALVFFEKVVRWSTEEVS